MIKKMICELEITGDLFIADSFMKRFVGYMFRREPHYEIIMIKPCNSIHTFFMKFDIDVLFINKDMEVIKKVEALGAGRVIMPVKDAVAVIEAKSGKFKKIKEGKKIGLLKN